MIDFVKVGKKITLNRKKLNLTQDDLAEMLLVTRQLVSKWENGVGVPSTDDLISMAKIFKISIDDLKSKKRNSSIAFPRQIAMYLCRKHTDESFPKIGIEFGGKDHSTVMFSCEKIEQEIKKDKTLADAIDKLEKEIHN